MNFMETIGLVLYDSRYDLRLHRVARRSKPLSKIISKSY